MKENEPIITMVHTMIENSALRPQLYQQVRSWTVNDTALSSAKPLSDSFCFSSKLLITLVFFLIPFFVSVSLEKKIKTTTQLIHAFQDAAVLRMALLNILLFNIKCAIFLKFLYRVFD